MQAASTLEQLQIGSTARVLIVAAHQDDETIGLGGALAGVLRPPERVFVAFLTDGTPVDPAYFSKTRNWTPDDYRRTRHDEAIAALNIFGIPPTQIFFSSIADQRLAFELESGFVFLKRVLKEARPSVVFVPAYEAGHPDHDAANFLVAHSLQNLAASAIPPETWEYPLYTARAGQIVYCRFPDPCDLRVVKLGPKELELKRRAIEQYASQRDTLAQFPIGDECFRGLPLYDYSKPAIDEPAAYELWGWSIRATDVSAQLAAFLHRNRKP
jgi:LmbE family N-acetylglucosaminyl deacetylase